MKQGYEDAAAEYGVEVEVQASRDEADLTGQLAIAEAMLQGDCDAFAVSPLSSSNLQPFLDRVMEAGIPLINVDDAKVEADVFVGGDHREMGVMAAEYIAEQLPDGGQVAQIEGQAGFPGRSAADRWLHDHGRRASRVWSWSPASRVTGIASRRSTRRRTSCAPTRT